MKNKKDRSVLGTLTSFHHQPQKSESQEKSGGRFGGSDGDRLKDKIKFGTIVCNAGIENSRRNV